MLEAVLTYLNNWFAWEMYAGTFTVTGRKLALPDLAEGQYFRIVGSVFNDGLHQYPATDLADETFTGAVWALAVPKAVIALAYTSESFSGYSYTRATNAKGAAVGWQDAFAAQLAPYRKLRDTSMVAPNPKGTPPAPRKPCWR